MSISKTAFRSWAKHNLRKTHDTMVYDTQSIIINKHLNMLLKTLKSKNILLYAPFGFEVDITKLSILLRKQKKKIFIPFIMEGIRFKMLPLRLPLQKNEYGILQTSKSLFTLGKIDTAVIPVLGIDKHFKRIGFGKGMYDRFFAQCQQKKIHIIFISRLACLSKQIITQSYDIQGAYFISATAYCKRTRYGNFFKSDRVYNLWWYSRDNNLPHNKKDF